MVFKWPPRPAKGTEEFSLYYTEQSIKKRCEISGFDAELEALSANLVRDDWNKIQAINSLNNFIGNKQQWKDTCHQVTEEYAISRIITATLCGARHPVIKHLMDEHPFKKDFQTALVQLAQRAGQDRDKNELMRVLLTSRTTSINTLFHQDAEISESVDYVLKIASNEDRKVARPRPNTQSPIRKADEILANEKFPVPRNYQPYKPTADSLIVPDCQTPLEWTLLGAGLLSTAKVLVCHGASLEHEIKCKSSDGHEITYKLRRTLFLPTAMMETDEEEKQYTDLLEQCWDADTQKKGHSETFTLWCADIAGVRGTYFKDGNQPMYFARDIESFEPYSFHRTIRARNFVMKKSGQNLISVAEQPAKDSEKTVQGQHPSALQGSELPPAGAPPVLPSLSQLGLLPHRYAQNHWQYRYQMNVTPATPVQNPASLANNPQPQQTLPPTATQQRYPQQRQMATQQNRDSGPVPTQSTSNLQPVQQQFQPPPPRPQPQRRPLPEGRPTRHSSGSEEHDIDNSRSSKKFDTNRR